MNLYESQRTLDVAGIILHNDTLSGQAKSLSTSFLADEHCEYALENYKYQLSKKLSPEDQLKLKRKFAGYIFEFLSYSWLRDRLEEDEILLSPEETFHIYELLYPDNEIIEDEFGFQKGIKGISLPDGLIMSPERDKEMTKITEVAEYTTVRSDNHEKQIQIINMPKRTLRNINHIYDSEDQRAKNAGEFIHESYWNLPEKFFFQQEGIKLKLVLPFNRPLPRHLKERIKPEQVEHLPIYSGQFLWLTELITSYVIPGN